MHVAVHAAEVVQGAEAGDLCGQLHMRRIVNADQAELQEPTASCDLGVDDSPARNRSDRQRLLAQHPVPLVNVAITNAS